MSEKESMATQGSLVGFRLWVFPHLLYLARQTGIVALSGLIAGLIVGGIGGRIAMRISAVAGGSTIAGLITQNQNVVGEITVGGTIGVLIIGGLFPGVFGGLIYGVVRHWLPGSGLRKGLVFGTLLLLVFGSSIIGGDNPDFSRFGPPLLNIALFAMLYILFGLAVAPIAEQLDRSFSPSSDRWAPNVLLAAPYLVLVFVVLLTVGTVVFGFPLFLLGFLALLSIGEWFHQLPPGSSRRRLAGVVGYLVLAVSTLFGLALDIQAVSAILAAAG